MRSIRAKHDVRVRPISLAVEFFSSNETDEADNDERTPKEVRPEVVDQAEEGESGASEFEPELAKPQEVTEEKLVAEGAETQEAVSMDQASIGKASRSRIEREGDQ